MYKSEESYKDINQGDDLFGQKLVYDTFCIFYSISQTENSLDINCQNADGLSPLLLVTRDIQLFEKLGDRIVKSYNPLDVVDELLAHRA